MESLRSLARSFVADENRRRGGEACLLKAGKKCGRCIEVCPVQALKEDGFDRRRCWDRLNDNRRTLDSFSDLPLSTHVCGKCAALMPCSFKNPLP